MKETTMKETTMTTKQYTAEDFAKASFARHPDGTIAARFHGGDAMPWFADDTNWFSNEGMASYGWVPVREAAAQPTTLDALRDAWETAEDSDQCNEGDILISRHLSDQFDRVEVWKSERSGPIGGYIRIHRRAPKPTPGMAERLEGAVEEWCNLTESEGPPPLTDWLAARGIIVTEEGEE